MLGIISAHMDPWIKVGFTKDPLGTILIRTAKRLRGGLTSRALGTTFSLHPAKWQQVNMSGYTGLMEMGFGTQRNITLTVLSRKSIKPVLAKVFQHSNGAIRLRLPQHYEHVKLLIIFHIRDLTGNLAFLSTHLASLHLAKT